MSDRGDATARAGFFILCGAAMGLALLFSRSRGGIVSGIVSLSTLTLGLRRYGGRPGRALSILPIVLGAVVAVWAAYNGVEGVVERLAQLVSGTDSVAGRGTQWADTFRAVRDFPILGSGLGTYAFHYPFYKTLRTQAVFDHAHNDYLELLSEGGVIGQRDPCFRAIAA